MILMINGYERASKEIVPAVRLVIIRELNTKYNMTEDKIAEVLGIAQAAVSKYINGNYSKTVGEASKKVDMNEVNAYIKQIADGNKMQVKACICNVCGSMNKFDCKFSEAKK